ncbi:MAG: hypothetical protein WAL29_13035 [Bacteroidales bacterium]
MLKKYPENTVFKVLAVVLLIASSCNPDNGAKKQSPSAGNGYIEISRENPAYFCFSDGTPYIPVGINMISPGGRYKDNADSSIYDFGLWMKKLSDNGGNYLRVWLSSPFWDIEDEHAGEFREEKARRIDSLIKMAGKYDLRIKMTLEHFRSLTAEENPQPWATRSVYHTSEGGPLDSIRQYLTSPEGHRLFLDKVDFYSKRYGSDTLFFGWELWNEMNAMKGPEDSIFFHWNEQMLNAVKEHFPENLVMQSLGSFDTEKVRPLYMKMMLMQGNEVAQVHRYLDLGAAMETCHMPMDIICSSAVEELRSYNTGKPVILAETGAVEPSHSGPSKYYPVDTAGIILHDILFAPFFSGSAGAGMSWHWDSYVDKNNLWYHFNRFSEAIRGINPIEEGFVPSRYETEDCRIYQLTGKKTILIWLRDKKNNWQSELRDGIPPEVSTINLDLKKSGVNNSTSRIEIYDPWKNKRSVARETDLKVLLPGFKRSLVVRIER